MAGGGSGKGCWCRDPIAKPIPVVLQKYSSYGNLCRGHSDHTVVFILVVHSSSTAPPAVLLLLPGGAVLRPQSSYSALLVEEMTIET